MPVQNFRRRILREWPAIAPLIKASYQASMPFPGPQRPFRAWLGLFGIPPIPKPGDGPTGGKLAPGVVAGHRRGLPAPGGLHLH